MFCRTIFVIIVTTSALLPVDRTLPESSESFPKDLVYRGLGSKTLQRTIESLGWKVREGDA